MLVREGLKKVIAFFAEYARSENDSLVIGAVDEWEQPPVSELIRHTRLNNRTDDPHVQQIMYGSVPVFNWAEAVYGFANGVINVFPRNSLP